MTNLRLETVLKAAKSHPWYRDVHTGQELSRWPVLTKSDLYSRLGATRGNADSGLGVYYSRSGGTNSDRPLFFPTDISENHLQRRLLARHLRADGVFTPQSVALNILPIVRMYRAMEIFNELCERCGATVLPMAALAEDDELFEQARLFQANTRDRNADPNSGAGAVPTEGKSPLEFRHRRFWRRVSSGRQTPSDPGDNAGSPVLRPVRLGRAGGGRMERGYRRSARLPLPT